MMRFWIGVALLAGSWLLGLDYFYPANAWAWFVAVVAAVALLSKKMSGAMPTLAVGMNTPENMPTASVGMAPDMFDALGKKEAELQPPVSTDGCRTLDTSRRDWLLSVVTLILLLPAVWYASWPYRAAPLLIALGLSLQLLPLRKRWTDCLAAGATTAGIVMLVQALALELYASQTAYSHELPKPLPDLLAGVASLLGIDAAADGSNIVMHSMRQVHRLGATWELLLDPATFLFYFGGLALLALRRNEECGMMNDECQTDLPAVGCEDSTDHSSFIIHHSSPWSAWIRSFRILTLIVLAWLPLRAGLMMSLYLHRVLRSDPDRSLHAMNHFFSPWMLLALLAVPVLLAWRFVRARGEGRGARGKEEKTPVDCVDGGEGGSTPSQSALTLALSQRERGPINSNPQSLIPNPCSLAPRPSPLAPVFLASVFLAPVLFALAVALFTAAIYWDPIGSRREGRVTVVERHSNWEPTTKPYDTASFGEASGYNYAAIYDYLAQYYKMSRLLEKDKIDDQTLAACDVLVIKTPTARYSPAETEAVARFVEQGGGLLLIGDHTNFERSGTIMNDITRRMGFTFRDDLLFGFGASPYDEHYVPASVPHPIVQRVGSMDFAVSCSIDPGASRGRPVVASSGLWSMGPEYHHENFHPIPQHCPEMRYGEFIQVWAARYGQGRAVAFTDSTIFSNFCAFQPGKAEMMLGMVEWLNHDNPPISGRLWLVLLAVPPLAAGLWMIRWQSKYLPSPSGRGAGGEGVQGQSQHALTLALSGHRPKVGRERGWLFLVAACTCGWVAASTAVAAANRWAMPTPERLRPQACAVIDRTTSTVPLSKGADIQGDGAGYGLLEQWIARTGRFTVRKEGTDVFSGDSLVVICPSRSVTEEFRNQLTRYVADGGRLLVIDSPENSESTAHSLLEPFGLSIHHDRAWKGKLTTTDRLPVVDIVQANEIVGGQTVGKLDKLPVAATTKFGKGSVMVVGFGSLWNDKRMGEHWMLEPSATVKARYDVLFALLRLAFDDKPLPASPPVKKKPVDKSPLKESGPAAMN